jgi:hypothetical protein
MRVGARWRAAAWRHRRLQLQASVRALGVVERGELAEHRAQVRLVHDDEVVVS